MIAEIDDGSKLGRDIRLELCEEDPCTFTRKNSWISEDCSTFICQLKSDK